MPRYAPPRMDLFGQDFGRLTVMACAGGYDVGRPRWLCLCDCGATKVVRGDHLRSGDVTSCGCARVDNMRQIGQRPKKKAA